MTSIPEPDAIEALPLSDVLQGFLAAQKLELRESLQLTPGLTLIQVDNDFSLVDTYVAYEPVPGRDPLELEDGLSRSAAEAPRTDVVVPDSLSDRIPELTSAARRHARRVVPLSDFLDSYLRPQRICGALLGHETADSASGRQRDWYDRTEAELLLNEDDFIDDQYAIASGSGRFRALHHLYTRWARGASPRLCIVIASAGLGKSKITHILAKRMARQYSHPMAGVRPPLPILISFGMYRRVSSFNGLVLEALDRFGTNLLTFDAFCYLIALGRIRFILDGYDEMIEASPDVARENIVNFVRQAGPQSRILLTARSNFYRTTADLVEQVGDRLLDASEVEVVELQPFNMRQAQSYITRRLSTIDRNSRLVERAQLMLDSHNLEVLGIPFFLAEFVNLISVESFSIPDARRLGILEYLIRLTFSRERVRQDHDFSDDQQQRFLEAIAFDLLVTGDAGYSRDDLEVFALEVATEEQLRQPSWPRLWSGLANHYFLVPEDDVPQARATMRHRVWRDYFQGSAIAVRLGPGERAREMVFTLLSTRDLPDGVLRSMAAQLSDAARSALLGKLSGGADTLLRNMLRMELPRREPEGDDMLVPPSEISAQLPGRDLSGTVFTRIRFDGSLANANLTDCLFEHCDLTRTVFDGALLLGTTFSACQLSATLASADVASVIIDNESFFGPQVRALFAHHDSPGQRPAAPDEFRRLATEVIRDRLAKFLRSSADEAYAGLRPAISWTAFMSGVNPKHRDFVVRRVYRALRAEGLIAEVSAVPGSPRVVRLTGDHAVRAEVLALVQRGEVGTSIERVVRRLAA